MKKLLVTTLVASSMAAAVYADGMVSSGSSMSDFYARGEAGVRLAGDPIEDSPLAGVGVGYQFNKMFGADAKLQYIRTKTALLSLNGYAGWHNSSKFVPYLTAGLGATLSNGTDLVDSWAGILGLGVKMNLVRSVDFDLGYRYVGLFTGTTGGANNSFFGTGRSHQILLGVLYHF